MRLRGPSGSIAAAMVAVTAVSCSLLFDNRDDAAELERQIRSMAGVAHTDMDYHSDFENGERFILTVQLSPDATDGQAADVGRSFAQGVAKRKLNSHQTDLDLRRPSDPPPPKNNYTNDYSDAGFHFGRNDTTESPTADDVADSAALWFRTAKSPAALRVDLLQPTWNGAHDSRQLSVTLRPEATHADALALQASEHGLADAWWQVSIVGDQTYRPHDYSSTPQPPTDSELELWRQISTVIGVSEEAKGSTRVPALKNEQAETTIEISLPYGAGAAPDAHRIAVAVAELMTGYHHPAQLTANTGEGPAEIIVGGCYRHDAKHVRAAIEIEMSAKYEKC
jgi:hypothetical protein